MVRKLQITGKGFLSIAPDIMIISFAVKAHDWEYEKAINLLNDKVEQLRQILKKNNLDRKLLKTKDFGVRRETSWNKKTEKNEFNGFKATHDLEMELPLDQKLNNTLLGQVGSTLEDLEFQIIFGVKDPAKHHQQLTKNAIKKAMESAGLIADASGVKLLEIIDIDCTIREIQIRSRTYDYRIYEQDTIYNAVSTPYFEPDDIDVSESVTITWRIE
jgi:uncharacterized protein YggE